MSDPQPARATDWAASGKFPEIGRLYHGFHGIVFTHEAWSTHFCCARAAKACATSAPDEHMKRRLDAALGAECAHTHLFSGLQKVVQAAGWVMRTLKDHGTVTFIHHRCACTDVRRLPPELMG